MMPHNSPPDTPHPKRHDRAPSVHEATSSNSDPHQEQLERAARSVEVAHQQAAQEAARASEFQRQLEEQQALIKELQERIQHRQEPHEPTERRSPGRRTMDEEKAKSPSHQRQEEAPSQASSDLREPGPFRRPTQPAGLDEILRRLDQIDRDREVRPAQPFPRRQGPFAPHIRRIERPPTLKSPRLAPYVGESDPTLHMDAFELVTLSKGYSDGLLCLLFVETLGGQAISWFLGLEENSVASFDDLRNAFLRRFKLLMESSLSVAQLFHQQQRPDESLREFLSRWLSTVGRCRNLDKQMALQAFKHCLAPGNFLFSITHLHKSAPYDEIIDLAATYAEAEEETWGVSKTRSSAGDVRPTQQNQSAKAPEHRGGAPVRQGTKGGSANSQRWQARDASAGSTRFQAGPGRSAAVHTVDNSVAVWYHKYKHLIPRQKAKRPGGEEA